MLDYRLETFLSLCQTLNYTKTSQSLHISQPAVSQHIHALEEKYGFSLFHYNKRKLLLTPQGEELYKQVLRIKAETKDILKQLQNPDSIRKSCHFAATSTIGNYLIPKIVAQWVHDTPDIDLTMKVLSTSQCLNAILDGTCDFALVEGYIDKTDYEYRLLKQAKIVLCAHPQYPLAKKKNVKLEEIFNYPLIIKERHSRLSGIVPHALAERNYSYDSFQNTISVGSINAMKKVIMHQAGIGFLHLDTIQEEVDQHLLKVIPINDFNLSHEMLMVWPMNSPHHERYEEIYNEIVKSLD